ncbi:MAG: hypothetical protein HFF44_06355 [Lawsonibacter sp.]|nr:hypothetical protein [Lawsonibacter sp.]
MKRNISDLLDQYPAEDFDLDGKTPYSKSKIKEITMNTVKMDRPVKKFKPARLLIAAAAAAALSVSALAAGQLFGAGDLFQDFFQPEDGALSQSQVDAMNQLGQVLFGEEGGPAPAPATSNGATITPIAAIADENVYYLRLRVEAPAGTALPDLDEEHWYQFFDSGNYNESGLTLEPAEGAYPDHAYGVTEAFTVLPDDEPNDNRKEFVITFTNHSQNGIALNDGVSKVLTIHGLWIQDKYKGYTPVFTGEFQFDIGLNFQSQTVDLDAKGVSWTDEALDFTNTLEYLTLSPLSLSYCYHTTLPDNKYFGPAVSISIVLKDGTEFVPGYDTTQELLDYLQGYYNMGPEDILPLSGGPGPDTEGFFPFDEPLDLSQVDYVAFGDVKIPVSVE